MKKILVIVSVLLLSTGLVFAQGQQDDGTIVIGLSMSAHTQFLENVSDAAVNQAESLEGVEIIVTNANDDIDTQINDVESLITKQVDAIILNPLDKAGLGRSVDNIKEAGIPLVEVNTFTNNDKYDVYVGSDEVEAGKIQGNWIAENIGETGNVCVLYGVMGHSGQIGRFEGLKLALLDKYDGWELLADMTGEWKRSEGLRISEDWLRSYGNEIDVIASQNDEMAIGAMQAVEESGFDIPVLGIDATPDAIKAVINDKLALTVFQNSFAQGTEAVNVAVGLVKGEEYPKNYVIPYEEVNKENAEEYLEKVSSWN
ncbi:MAG: substrate-binding domain-containing protein [Spirochaetales bacterium]|nr:substrate-binding domain-containing protein [Spirochaetales bacterium]